MGAIGSWINLNVKKIVPKHLKKIFRCLDDYEQQLYSMNKFLPSGFLCFGQVDLLHPACGIHNLH